VATKLVEAAEVEAKVELASEAVALSEVEAADVEAVSEVEASEVEAE